MLAKKGIDPFSVSVLDRLAIVGSGGMGALEYKPEENFAADVKKYDFDTLAREIEAILNENYNQKNLMSL
jgi:serine/threonine-protein kinase HipA